jgi:protein-tyrosine phosphatase
VAPSAVDGLRVSDIGGLPLKDGRWFRSGLVFRISGGMVGPAELAHLDEIGLRVLVDLRGEDEDRHALEGWARSRGVHYALEPISLGNAADVAAAMAQHGHREADGRAFLQSIYRRILDDFAPSLVGAVTAIANDQPAGFGCAAGKDRTGLLSALVQDVLGVDRAAIVAGYVSQAPDPERLRAAVGTWREWGEADLTLPGVGAILAAVEEVMVEALEHLDQRYGGAVCYFESAGLPAETIDALRQRLVADKPG